ncbi:MAG: hypothetical protein Q9190_002535 [Brigantiaea leucoxantha]
MRSKIKVLPHNPLHVEQFSCLKVWLESILSSIPIVSIEHIGSTSIPNLPAKPVIDIDVIIHKGNLEQVIQVLMDCGVYSYRGELGLPGRHFFQPGNTVEHNLYVCIEGCLALRNHLEVKKILLQDSELRREYGEVKLKLAKDLAEGRLLCNDDYNIGKNEIVAKILEKSDLSEEDRAFIVETNATRLAKRDWSF